MQSSAALPVRRSPVLPADLNPECSMRLMQLPAAVSRWPSTSARFVSATVWRLERAGETANIRRKSMSYCEEASRAAVQSVEAEAREETVECAVDVCAPEDSVEAFRVTDRLSEDERAALMGGSLVEIYDWTPSRRSSG
jgi:hypothetical protein